jgi:hypothetical protein
MPIKKSSINGMLVVPGNKTALAQVEKMRTNPIMQIF